MSVSSKNFPDTHKTPQHARPRCIADAVCGGLRAADAERLTVAAEANSVPENYRTHLYSYHNPMILVPRPKRDETRAIVTEIARRLSGAGDDTVFMVPMRGVSSYSAKGVALYDEKADAELVEAIRQLLLSAVKRVEIDASAEDEAFVSAAVAQLTDMIDRKRTAA